MVSLLEQVVRLCWKLCTLLSLHLWFSIWFVFSPTAGDFSWGHSSGKHVFSQTWEGEQGRPVLWTWHQSDPGFWQKFFAKKKKSALFLLVVGVGWLIWLTVRSPQMVAPVQLKSCQTVGGRRCSLNQLCHQTVFCAWLQRICRRLASLLGAVWDKKN